MNTGPRLAKRGETAHHNMQLCLLITGDECVNCGHLVINRSGVGFSGPELDAAVIYSSEVM